MGVYNSFDFKYRGLDVRMFYEVTPERLKAGFVDNGWDENSPEVIHRCREIDRLHFSGVNQEAVKRSAEMVTKYWAERGHKDAVYQTNLKAILENLSITKLSDYDTVSENGDKKVRGRKQDFNKELFLISLDMASFQLSGNLWNADTKRYDFISMDKMITLIADQDIDGIICQMNEGIIVPHSYLTTPEIARWALEKADARLVEFLKAEKAKEKKPAKSLANDIDMGYGVSQGVKVIYDPNYIPTALTADDDAENAVRQVEIEASIQRHKAYVADFLVRKAAGQTLFDVIKS